MKTLSITLLVLSAIVAVAVISAAFIDRHVSQQAKIASPCEGK